MPRFEIDVRYTYIINSDSKEEALEKLEDIEEFGNIEIDFEGYDKSIILVREISNDD